MEEEAQNQKTIRPSKKHTRHEKPKIQTVRENTPEDYFLVQEYLHAKGYTLYHPDSLKPLEGAIDLPEIPIADPNLDDANNTKNGFGFLPGAKAKKTEPQEIYVDALLKTTNLVGEENNCSVFLIKVWNDRDKNHWVSLAQEISDHLGLDEEGLPKVFLFVSTCFRHFNPNVRPRRLLVKDEDTDDAISDQFILGDDRREEEEY